jgi:hypothetical protein
MIIALIPASAYAGMYVCTYLFSSNESSGNLRVRIKKREVTYDLGKISVKSCAKLPNFLKYTYYTILCLLKIFLIIFWSQTLYFHFKNDISNV